MSAAAGDLVNLRRSMPVVPLSHSNAALLAHLYPGWEHARCIGGGSFVFIDRHGEPILLFGDGVDPRPVHFAVTPITSAPAGGPALVDIDGDNRWRLVILQQRPNLKWRPHHGNAIH